MNNKIPCGGFYLSDTLGVDENGKLGVNGGEPYKSLVTDGDGSVKWEDRLAYEGNRIVVELDNAPNGKLIYVKVADEIPEWVLVEETQVKVWTTQAPDAPVEVEVWFNSKLGVFMDDAVGFFLVVEKETTIPTLEDSAFSVFSGAHFPEKGIYFLQTQRINLGNFSVTGIAPATSDTPEITWDGSLEILKTIDPKYIPSELNEIILPSSTPGSSKKFKITVDDSGTISATEVTP